MIHFYYDAGKEETKGALTDAIRAVLRRGERALLLVPEQETVTVERRMLHALPPAAQLSFEVVNFTRLANRTFRELGGHRWRTATGAVRSLLMWHSLRELAPMLTRYGKHATEPHLCDMMLDTASRCRAYRIKAEDLLTASEQIPQSEPLHDKLVDIGTVLGSFEAFLAERFDNGDDDLDRLAELLEGEGSTLFADTHVFVDSFTDFTGQERRVLRALMAIAPSVSFTFPLASAHDEGLHLDSAMRTHRELQRLGNELSLEIEMHRTKKTKPQSAREYLVEHLFDMNAESAPLSFIQESDVSLTVCASPFAEAEAAAAEIHRLVRTGCRYRDIAVVLRDANTWSGILDAALEREGIPYFLSEKTDVTVRPLVKLILLALRIKLHGWRDEDVIAYLKTGLCGVGIDDVNLLEEYVCVWHPRGEAAYAAPFTRNPDGYQMRISARGEGILAGANRAREVLYPPLLALFSALDAAHGATDMCRAIHAFLCALNVSEQLKARATSLLAAGERREAEELSRLYTVTLEALEALSDALEDEPLSTSELLDALKLVFARTDIGTIPTSTDEVTVGSASMLRADHPRYVLVLGLVEGEFPRPVSDDGLICEGERERLVALDLPFPSGRAERSSDELFFIHRAFCAPRDGLYLSYSKSATDGRANTPSIAIERTQKLLAGLPVRVFEAVAATDTIFTPAGALDRLGDLNAAEREEIGALLRELHVSAAHSLSRPVVEQEALVGTETAAALFDKSRFSPTHLESYSSCRFAYYCDKILRLREEKDGSLGPSDTGTFIHYVLEHALKRARVREGGFAAWSEQELDSLVLDICTAYRRDLVETGGDLTPRASALLDRLSRLARLVVTSLMEEFADSLFVPAFTEFDLRDTGTTPTLTLEDGKSIPLSGKTDRIDVWCSPEGEAFLRVVDYKTGTRKFSVEDIKKGRSLQMPLYLMALCARPYPALNRALGLPEDTQLQGAGVTYFSSAVSAETTPSLKDESEAMRDATDRLERSGVLLDHPAVLQAASLSADPAIIGGPRSKRTLDRAGFDTLFADLADTVSRLTSEMRGGKATARPNREGNRIACEYCRFAAICRVAQKEMKGGS